VGEDTHRGWEPGWGLYGASVGEHIKADTLSLSAPVGICKHALRPMLESAVGNARETSIPTRQQSPPDSRIECGHPNLSVASIDGIDRLHGRGVRDGNLIRGNPHEGA